MTRHRQAAAIIAGTLFAIIAAGTTGAQTGGASLSLSPSSGSYAPGGTFTVKVVLNSGGGIGVNAADGHLTFDPTLLSVQSISKDNSVFNLWTSNPSFSNTAGTIDYSGGSNNAYTGSSGDVIDVTFKALAAGTAAVKFSSATALAADGQGTNILSGTNGGTYTVGGTAAPAPSAPPASSGNSASSQSAAASSAAAPFTTTITITSPTHSNPGQWYNNDSPSFAWTLTPDIAGVNVVLDQSPTTFPKKTSAGLLSSKQYSAVGQGTWYFHARFEDALGEWSDPANFQVNIDLTSPLPFTVTAATGAGVSGRTELMFNATDTVSGIDHYVATFDGAATSTIALSDVQNGVYTAPPLLAGKHVVQVSAFDKAGNYTDENVEFSIPGVAAPDITNFPAVVVEKSPIVIEGVADSGANVTVDINDSNGKSVSEGNMIADETGHWIYAVENGVSGGKYTLGVSMLTTQGAFASSTKKLTMEVTSAPFLERFGWILIVLLLACLAALVVSDFYKKKLLAERLVIAKRENGEVREKTKAVFEALREEMDEQISHMEGGAAQAQGEAKLEPEHVLDEMRNALVVSETTIQKEIDDVDKALNEE